MDRFLREHGNNVRATEIAALLPKEDKDFESAAYRKNCLRFFKLMCAASLGKINASGDAMNALNKMNALNHDIRRFFGDTGAEYPVWQAPEQECGRCLRRNE